jgi:hypothetical protein
MDTSSGDWPRSAMLSHEPSPWGQQLEGRREPPTWNARGHYSATSVRPSAHTQSLAIGRTAVLMIIRSENQDRGPPPQGCAAPHPPGSLFFRWRSSFVTQRPAFVGCQVLDRIRRSGDLRGLQEVLCDGKAIVADEQEGSGSIYRSASRHGRRSASFLDLVRLIRIEIARTKGLNSS